MLPFDVSNFSAALACIGALGLVGMVAWIIWATRGGKFRDETEEEFDQQYLARQCLNCGYDMRASIARCPECGTKFVDRHHYLHSLANDWPTTPIAPRIPAPQEQPVVLLNTKDPTEANYLQQQLLSRGIACSVRRGPPRQRFSHPELYGAAPYSVSINWNEVMVYEQDLDLAQAYLRRVQVTEEIA